jgi:adenosine deaminase
MKSGRRGNFLGKLFAKPAGIYESLPKVDLHRHLEGSLRVQTLIDIAHKHSLTLPHGIMRLNRLVQVQEEEPYTFENFLAKFNTLRLFYRSPEVIHRITREAIEDAASDNVKYMEMRFTPVALSRAERFPLADVVDWVCTSAREAAKKFGTAVRLIASVNRHESPELAEQVAWLAAARMDKGIVGLDLAGNEAQFSAEPFVNIFREAKQSGLKVTVHAGEWGGPENIRQAIEQFSADRIGHGVRILEDDFTTALARDRHTAFEVCLTSNYQTGVVKEIKLHPLKKMLDAGLNATINTDDPSISQITLSNEYKVAIEDIGISMENLKERILAAAQCSFLLDNEKLKLVEQLGKLLK